MLAKRTRVYLHSEYVHKYLHKVHATTCLTWTNISNRVGAGPKREATNGNLFDRWIWRGVCVCVYVDSSWIDNCNVRMGGF